MFITSIFKDLLNYIKAIWNKIPQESKEEIFKVILDAIKKVLIAYYKEYTEKQNANQKKGFSNA